MWHQHTLMSQLAKITSFPLISDITDKASGELETNLKGWQAYCTLVHTVFKYASLAWYPIQHRDVCAIERMNKWAATFCEGYSLQRSNSECNTPRQQSSLGVPARKMEDHPVFLYQAVQGKVPLPIDIFKTADARVRSNFQNNFKHLCSSRWVGAAVILCADCFSVEYICLWHQSSTSLWCHGLHPVVAIYLVRNLPLSIRIRIRWFCPEEKRRQHENTGV